MAAQYDAGRCSRSQSAFPGAGKRAWRFNRTRFGAIDVLPSSPGQIGLRTPPSRNSTALQLAVILAVEVQITPFIIVIVFGEHEKYEIRRCLVPPGVTARIIREQDLNQYSRRYGTSCRGLVWHWRLVACSLPSR